MTDRPSEAGQVLTLLHLGAHAGQLINDHLQAPVQMLAQLHRVAARRDIAHAFIEYSLEQDRCRCGAIADLTMQTR